MRPTTDQAKKAQGTFTPARSRPALGLPLGVPQPPTELTAKALSVWNDVVPDLKKSGVLAKVDRIMIAIYCELSAEFLEDARAMSAGKLKELRMVAAELGLSIGARLKIRAPEGAEPTEEACKPTPQGGNVVSISGLLSSTRRMSAPEASMPADTSASPASDS